MLLVFIVGGIIAYREGYLWKTTIELSPEMKRLEECPLHKTCLKIEKVKVHTGRSHHSEIEGSFEARAKYFPYYNNDQISTTDPKVSWAMVKYCPGCRSAIKKWLDERPRKEVEHVSGGNGG